jgi:Bacterial SH3 domain
MDAGPSIQRFFQMIRGLPANASAVLIVAMVSLLGASCRTGAMRDPSAEPGVSHAPAAQDASLQGREENRPQTINPEAASHTVDQCDAAVRQVREENTQQMLQLIEKEGLIEHLERQLASQQRLLDDAVLEVVRAKAKQRSLESRAEAAAEMAEAEIGLKSLRERAGDAADPELDNTEQLLAVAGREFEAQNFGGALYLIGRAKTRIRLETLRLDERDQVEGLEGEAPFAVPLPLMVNTVSNLREGPGREFKIIVTLGEGARITGYSTKGPWLRVESEGGLTGWIHRSLVSAG